MFQTHACGLPYSGSATPSPSTSTASVTIGELLVAGSFAGHDADVTVHALHTLAPPGSQMILCGIVVGQYSSSAAFPVPSAAWVGLGQSLSCEPAPDEFK